MKYESPEIEVIRFGYDDIIRTSGTNLPIDESSAGSTSSLF